MTGTSKAVSANRRETSGSGASQDNMDSTTPPNAPPMERTSGRSQSTNTRQSRRSNLASRIRTWLQDTANLLTVILGMLTICSMLFGGSLAVWQAGQTTPIPILPSPDTPVNVTHNTSYLSPTPSVPTPTPLPVPSPTPVPAMPSPTATSSPPIPTSETIFDEPIGATVNGLTLAVTGIAREADRFRIFITAQNDTGDTLTLPIFGYFVVIDDHRHQYEGDPNTSNWPGSVAPGAVVSGEIVVARPLPGDVTTLTRVGFTQVFGSLAFGYGRGIYVENVPVP